MTAAPAWDDVEQRLLEQVFHRHDAQDVRRSTDLPADGVIDSLSITAALEVLVELSDDDRFLFEATPDDFRSLQLIEELYSRVVGAPSS